MMSILGNLFGKQSNIEKRLAGDAVLIDVRNPGEFASGYIDGAISMPLGQLGVAVQSRFPDRNTAIILYCLSGARSAAAKNELIKLGYVNVSNGGGIGSLAIQLHKVICKG